MPTMRKPPMGRPRVPLPRSSWSPMSVLTTLGAREPRVFWSGAKSSGGSTTWESEEMHRRLAVAILGHLSRGNGTPWRGLRRVQYQGGLDHWGGREHVAGAAIGGAPGDGQT